MLCIDRLCVVGSCCRTKEPKVINTQNKGEIDKRNKAALIKWSQIEQLHVVKQSRFQTQAAEHVNLKHNTLESPDQKETIVGQSGQEIIADEKAQKVDKQAMKQAMKQKYESTFSSQLLLE